MNIDDVIDQIFVIPRESKNALRSCMEEIWFPKGHILFEADKVEKDIYFVASGLVRAYVDTEDAQVTFWFGMEGDTLLSLKSYARNERSYESIELLEKSRLYRIKTDALQRFYEQDIHLATWGRKLAEHEWIKAEERLISMQFKSAAARYQELVEKTPKLLQRVQLSYLASYLGITQVSLSRIRSDFR